MTTPLSLMRSRIQEIFRFDAGKDNLLDGIKAIAEDARFNPVNEWLNLRALVWDGKPRIATWFPKITGTPATPLFYAAGELILLSMVMRARFPDQRPTYVWCWKVLRAAANPASLVHWLRGQARRTSATLLVSSQWTTRHVANFWQANGW